MDNRVAIDVTTLDTESLKALVALHDAEVASQQASADNASKPNDSKRQGRHRDAISDLFDAHGKAQTAANKSSRPFEVNEHRYLWQDEHGALSVLLALWDRES